MTTPTTERAQRCRYLVANKRGSVDRCTNEVAEEGAEIDLCVKHLTDAMTLIARRLHRWAVN